MSVKGFKLKNGDIVRYDYSALDDIVIDDTLAVTGAAADAKATGDAIEDAIDNMESKIGDLSDLTTTDKTSTVNAINELKTDIGDLSDLTTTNKTSAVDTINELKTDIDDLNSRLPLVVERMEVSFDPIAANSVATVITDCSKNGYTAIGVVGWANSGSSNFYPYELRVVSTNLRVYIKNITSSIISNAGITIYVLYQKN